MTQIEETLVARLLAETTLTALVGQRIEPVLNSQDTALPALSYQLISRAGEHSQDGPAINRPRIQLTALATTYSQVVAVLAACKTAVDGVSWGGGVSSFCENEFDGYQADSRETGVFVRRMDVLVVDP
jgi:hypothetical protein